MSFQKLLKMVDDRSKDSVFGYIRQSRDTSKDAAIPMMIQYCCLRYYFINEYFSKHGNNLTISDNGQIVTALESGLNSKHNSAHGNIIIDPTNEYITQYEWKIQLLKFRGGYFGIAPFESSSDSGYKLGLLGGTITNHKEIYGYAGRIYQNDTISMVFNVTDKSLSFHHNGTDLGNIPYTIDMKRKYKMIVTLFTKNQSVQMLQYKERYN